MMKSGESAMRQLYLRDHSTDRHTTTVIHDARGQSCYLLAGKWGIRYDALSLYTMSGELLAEAKQLTLGLTPKFALYQGRNQVGTIGRTLGFFNELIYIHGLNWIVVGSLTSGHFKVFSGSHLVFEFEPVRDSAGLCNLLTVDCEANEPLAILITTILNHWAHHPSRQPLKELKRRFNTLHEQESGDLSMGCSYRGFQKRSSTDKCR